MGTQDTFVDLNALPLGAVERVEVLKDGASAAYGSDAIAGVINIILKRDYQGAEASASIGAATEGGLSQYTAGLLAGVGSLNDDGYNINFSLDFLDRESLNANQRTLTRSGDFRQQPGGRLAGWLTGGGNYLDDPQNPRAFETCPGVSETRDWSDFNPSRTGEVCAFNGQPFNTLQPEVTRHQLALNGTYVLNSRLEAFTEVLYSYNESSHIFGAPLTIGPGLRAYDESTGTLEDIAVAFPVGHPNNPTEQPLAFEYTFFDIGERLKSNTQIFNRFLTGLRYQGSHWDLNLNALQSQSRQREYIDNFVNRYAFETLLSEGSYGFIGGDNSAENVEALRLDTRRPGFYQIRSINLNASRILAHWRHGDVAIASGIDWRNEQMNAGTSPEVLSGTELRLAINLIDGERDVLAGFVELKLPLFENFTLNTALRADHYDDFGSAVSPKLSAHYVLAEDWLLRGSWSRGFRAPSLPEIAQSNTISYSSVIDPQDPVEPGATRGFTQLRSGNPDLDAERSTNLNAGIVWSPQGGLSAAFDVFRVEQDNVIASDNAQFIVNNADIYGDRIQRDAAGRLQIITNQYANQGTRTTSGFDFDVNYLIEIGAGDLRLGTTWSRLMKYEQALVAGEAFINGAGNNQFGALPKWKSSTSANWQQNDWQLIFSADHTSGYEQRRVTETSNPGFAASVSSHLTFNAQIAYSGLSNTQLRLSVQNLTDAQPPFDPAAGANFFDMTQYNARGRVINLAATYTF